MLRAFSFLLIELHMKQDFVFLLAGYEIDQRLFQRVSDAALSRHA